MPPSDSTAPLYIRLCLHCPLYTYLHCVASQVLTQVSLLLLLFGTIVGDFALISDVSARAFKGLAAPNTPPAWLVAYDGRGTMCLFAVVAVFPLCCLKGMRQVCGNTPPYLHL